jgi:hypothetical protein
MTTEPPGRLSFEDYLALEETSETTHEYDDGILTAMAGAVRHLVGMSDASGSPMRISPVLR